MNFKQTALLLGIGLALIAGLIGYSLFTGTGDETDPGDLLFPGLAGTKIDEIDSVEIVRTQPKTEKLIFTRTGPNKRWKATAPTSAAVEPMAVDGLVQSLMQLKPVAYGELKPNPAAHGLAEPSITITIRQGSSKSATLNVGLTTIGGESAVTFVTTSARPDRPLAIRKRDLAPLWRDPSKADGEAWAAAKGLTDFRVRRLLATDIRDAFNDVAAVRIKSGTSDLHLKLEANGLWQFVSPANFGEADPGGDPQPNATSLTGVRPLLNLLTLLGVQDLSDYLESPLEADLAKYGLKADDPNALRIELTSRTGVTEVLYVGAAVDPKAVPVKRYARLEGDSCVVRIPFERFDLLKKTAENPAELRQRDLIAATLRDRIDAIDITLGTTTASLRRLGPAAEGRWYVTGSGEPRLADRIVVDQILQTLTRPRLIADFPATPDAEAFSTAETKASLRLWSNGLKSTSLPEAGKPFPDPKPEGVPIVLTLGRKVGDLVFVRKAGNDKTSDAKVPEGVLAAVAKSRLDLLAANVPPFVVSKVNRLAIDRGPDSVDVRKAKEPDPQQPLGKWTFEAPAARKGQIADQPRTQDLLGLLAGLRSFRVVSENPNEADLKRFGFLPASSLKATVELADEPGVLRTYEFGAETEDKAFVYTRHSGSTLVYTVARSDAERLRTTNLRDAVVARFSRDKVTGITIRGFQGTTPAPQQWIYERNGNTWVAKEPAGATVDPIRVNGFLNSNEILRAATFLGPAKPEHKLDVAAGAVEVTIRQDGLPPLVLTLGAEIENGQNYIARVSSLPNEAFTIPTASLRSFVGTPNGLAATPQAPAPKP